MKPKQLLALSAAAVLLAGCTPPHQKDSDLKVETANTFEAPAENGAKPTRDAHGSHEHGSATSSSATTPTPAAGAHAHAMDGGAAPAGMQEAENPTYPEGTTVTLLADHMPGMEGTTAEIVGAFQTETYSVTYQPTDGGDLVVDHKWVVKEETKPGELPNTVVLEAEHMPGMEGATATIDSTTTETVYMVDIIDGEMPMKNHKWVTESEISPQQ